MISYNVFARRLQPMTQCLNCKRESQVISRFLHLCAPCIKTDFDKCLSQIENAHALSRKKFYLPERIPKSPTGLPCNCCANECRLAEGEKGFCGLRSNKRGKITVSGIRNCFGTKQRSNIKNLLGNQWWNASPGS
jgi:hypothetical protein